MSETNENTGTATASGNQESGTAPSEQGRGVVYNDLLSNIPCEFSTAKKAEVLSYYVNLLESKRSVADARLATAEHYGFAPAPVSYPGAEAPEEPAAEEPEAPKQSICGRIPDRTGIPKWVLIAAAVAAALFIVAKMRPTHLETAIAAREEMAQEYHDANVALKNAKTRVGEARAKYEEAYRAEACAVTLTCK